MYPLVYHQFLFLNLLLYPSYLFLPTVKFNIIAVSELLKADTRAAALPPPGVGSFEDSLFIYSSSINFF